MHYTQNAVVIMCLVSPLVTSVYSQSSQCKSHQSCNACIQTPNCVWCSEKREAPHQDGVPPIPRCIEEGSANTKKEKPWCSKENIVNPKPFVNIYESKPFSSDKDHQVQIKPQRVKMVLRRGEKQSLKINYQQANNYPVDLYFLMDLSASMETHKNNLAKLGSALEAAMKNLTTDFRLGFGSFVDKVILPMTSTQTVWLMKCKLKDTKKKCAPPYSYKHQMDLTDDITQFQSNVENAPLSGNLDAPEGGLDAIMQAIVCWDKIGWRKKARHIIVYSSDQTYHIAGDGRLAGLIEPNDEKCHLDAAGSYTHAEILDYPSIPQINKQATENNINIIFAVASGHRKVQSQYKALTKRINGSSLAMLEENSESVVALVRRQYEKLTKEIIMIDNATKPLEVKYFTRCLNKNEPPQEHNECSGVRVNASLEFDVTIKAVDCPQQMEDWHQTIEIKPQGVNERVIIEVEIICDCPCSRPTHKDYESDSTMCTKSGDLTCGVCNCKHGFYGKKCNCQGDNDEHQSVLSDQPCRGDDNKICSGRGSCICGVCKCDPRPNTEEKFDGQFCECDNFSCERFEGLVCGGPSRGRCECGTCVCQPGLGNAACDCRTSNSTCIPPGEDKKMCNGFGDCICGSCQCTKEGRSGTFCEECPTCPSQRCDELKNCVECRVHGTGPEFDADGETCSKCSNSLDIVELVDDIDEDPRAIHKQGTHVCTVLDSSGCTFVFTYPSNIRGDNPIADVTAEKGKKCPEPVVNAYGVAGGAIALTLFLGLLGLLIWKILTMYHDHREWVKFEKERVCASWERGENPLFKEPTTSFKNPTFEGVKG